MSTTFSPESRLTCPKAVLALALAILSPLPAAAQGAFEPGIEGQIWKQLPPVGLPTCTTDPDSGDCLTPPDTSPGHYYYPLAITSDLLQGSAVTTCASGNKIVNFVTDQWNRRVQAFDYCGNPYAFPTAPTLPGPDYPENFGQPEGITTDAAHHIVVVDRDNSRIVVFNQDGSYLFHFDVPFGTYPTGVAVFPGTVVHPSSGTGAVAVVLSAGGHSRILIYDSAGNFLMQNGQPEVQENAGGDGLWGPSGVAIDRNGLLYVSDYGNSRIAAYTADFSTNTVVFQFTFGRPIDPGNPQPEELQLPYGLIPTTLGGQQRLIIADQLNQRIAVYSIDFPGPIGSPVITFLFYLDARGDLNGSPTGVAQDQQSRLYAVDLGNHRIQRFEVGALAVVDVSANPAGLIPNGATFTITAGVAVPLQKSAVEHVMPSIAVTSADPGVSVTLVDGPTPLAPAPATLPTPVIGTGQIAYYSWRFSNTGTGGSATLTIDAAGDPNPNAPDGAHADPPRPVTVTLGCSSCETVPPVTTASVTASGSFAGPTVTWYSSPAIVHFTSADASNVRELRVYLTGAQGGASLGLPQCADQLSINIEYCIEAPPATTTLNTTISLSAGGSTVVHFRAVDAFGNIETEQTRTVAIDVTQPIVTVTTVPASPNGSGWFKSATVTANWTYVDSGSGMATPPSGSLVVSAEGITTHATEGVDNVGNGGFGQAGQFTIRLDRTPPVLTAVAPVVVELTSLAGTPATLASPTATDPAPASTGSSETNPVASGVASITSNAPVSGLYPFTPAGASNASITTVTFTATDVAGNIATTTATVTVRDTTGPSIVSVPTPVLSTTPSSGTVALPDLTALLVATDLNGPVTVTQSPAPGTALAPGSRSVTFTARDRFNNPTVQSVTFIVADGTPPLFTPPANVTLPFGGPGGVIYTYASPVATDLVDGPVPVVCTPPSGSLFPIGANTVTCTATDRAGNRTTKTFTVTVSSSNAAPSCSAATASTGSLWPPNHQLVPITVKGVTDSDGDAVTIMVLSIFQDEPTNAAGDGSTALDGFGVGTSTAQVRAERSGQRNGRVYSINFSASDSRGGSCTGTVTVGVPHDQGKGKIAIGDGALYNSTVASLPSGDDEDDDASGNSKPKKK